jgi:N-acetylglucosamine kinase-like BadF-type ATPase
MKRDKDEDEKLIAADGGATKTDMVLFHPDGTVTNRVIGGPTNSSEIGFDRSAETLRVLFTRLLEKQGGLESSIRSLHLGIAGGGIESNRPRYYKLLREMFPHATYISNGSDAISALNTGLRKKDGMVLIGGTGSAVFVRRHGEIRQVGGWGHLLSDEGSGYDIGRMGLSRVLQALDGRKPPTLLTELMTRTIGQPVDKAIPEIYNGGKRYISSLAPLVFEAAESGDDAAMEILCESARRLSILVIAGSRFLADPPYPVVLSGGLWAANDQLLQRLVFEQLDSRFIAIRPALPPVFGSAVEAMDQAGYPIDVTFEKQFKVSLESFSNDPVSPFDSRSKAQTFTC